ncbi:MAG: BREX system Lon protease-like protein BrxL [Candidatus Cloacimonas sp.]|jgi:ATP-dependent Lon protease|nr:BREX system Lon protease-like protein BrxL [Candidatus Cloacimonas sp.]HOH46637.1 BREX system Lon protease-like protein BrxL [Candidatus Cloacimonadota bacterium]
MNKLDEKINEQFQGLVVRKDLVKTVKGNAIVPTYVLEYLLGQYCATSDEAEIQAGIETVKNILEKHYVHRRDAELTKSNVREFRINKVIDKISVTLNEKKDCYQASFSNMGISKVVVSSEIVKNHPKLLVSGVWCIAEVEYCYTEDKESSPWLLNSIKPIQMSNFDMDSFLAKRSEFTSDEWIDLLIQSIGFNPEFMSKRLKLMQLTRLVPYCERNYNLIELGPKGTGKSHIYSEFSPYGILISGGEVSVPKLFVNNANGRIGLVGFWDVVAFDEFAGRKKKADKALVDIMKNYMANKNFSRGIETLGAEASMTFVGNTKHNVAYMLKHSDLFDELPEQYYDSAYLDRLHGYLPGWEVPIIRSEMFSSGYGFVVDYLAEILRAFRNQDFSALYREHFELVPDISTRDRDGVQKTFSGLMKVIYPNQVASKEEIKELLEYAMENRKRVKDQLMRIDKTYAAVRFAYTEKNGDLHYVMTAEEIQYPSYYYDKENIPEDEQELQEEQTVETSDAGKSEPKEKQEELVLKPCNIAIQDNQTGISYRLLFARYLKGSKRIEIKDPFIGSFHQCRNLMEFLEVVAAIKSDADEVEVHLITKHSDYKDSNQEEYFRQIESSCSKVGITFTYEIDDTIHDRYIQSDNGWKIILGRGLDIFHKFDDKDAFAIENRNQRYRKCRAFEVTYMFTM